jgi:hypothetical protein
MTAGQTISGVIDDAEFQYFTIRPDIAREEIRSATVSIAVAEFLFVSASACVACVLEIYLVCFTALAF